jgi:PPOX class probable F420-dependent enzyme
MTVAEKVAAFNNRIYLRVRHRDAFRAATETGTVQRFEHLRGHKYALLTTFKRSGEPIPTPVWFGVGEDGNVYFRSEAKVGKVKRIRNDPHVRLGPCNLRGKPLGPTAEGRARVLPPKEEDRAEAAIQGNYGLGRRLYEKPGASIETVYIEVSPGAGPAC